MSGLYSFPLILQIILYSVNTRARFSLYILYHLTALIIIFRSVSLMYFHTPTISAASDITRRIFN